jgi:hypothetical protein
MVDNAFGEHLTEAVELAGRGDLASETLRGDILPAL